METLRGELKDLASILKFVTAGAATITLVSAKTGSRFTYRIAAPKKETERGGLVKDRDADVRFVSVLTGSDNLSDYTFLGTIFRDGTYRHSAKSRIGVEAPSARAFAWFAEKLFSDDPSLLDAVTIFHEGSCGRCGRTLTVPESVATGFGPECSGKLGIERVAVEATTRILDRDLVPAGGALIEEPETATETLSDAVLVGPSLGAAPVGRFMDPAPAPMTVEDFLKSSTIIRSPRGGRRSRKPAKVSASAQKYLDHVRALDAGWLSDLQAGIDEDRAKEVQG